VARELTGALETSAPAPQVETGSLLPGSKLLALSPRSGWVWVGCFLAGLLAGEVLALVVASVVGVALGHGSALSSVASRSVLPPWYVVSSLLGLWLGFLGGAALAVRVAGTGQGRAELGLSARPLDLIGLPIGLACQGAIAVLYALAAGTNQDLSGPAHKLADGFHGWAVVVIVVLTGVGAPVVEEIFFRGVLLRGLASLTLTGRRTTVSVVLAGAAAVVLDGLCFAAAHAQGLQFAGLAALGVVLALCHLRTGRLGMSIAAHMAFNLVAVLALVGVVGGPR